MSTDKELMGLAAKAAGIEPPDFVHDNGTWAYKQPRKPNWNPLIDDGDALRLAVKLRLDIDHHEDSVNVWDQYIGTGYINNGDDPAAATRRAIVCAAAEIGKAMQ